MNEYSFQPQHSAILFNEFTRVLDVNNIPHGKLQFMSRSNNDAFYDDIKKTFIKSSLFEESDSLTRELNFALCYGDRIPTFKPLIPEVVKVRDSETNKEGRYATFWQFENDIQVATTLTLDSHLVNAMVGRLMEIHSLPLMDFVEPYQYNWIPTVVERRVVHAKNRHRKDDKHVAILKELVDHLLKPEYFNWPKELMVVNHGDAHLGNFARINGVHQWFDYESVVALPREWDIAATSLTLRRHRDLEPLWEEAVEKFSTVSQVNFKLVEFFETVKLLTSSSYMLLHPYMYENFNKRMELMESMLNGATLPPKLPNLPHRPKTPR